MSTTVAKQAGDAINGKLQQWGDSGRYQSGSMGDEDAVVTGVVDDGA